MTKKREQRVIRTDYTITIEAENWWPGEWNPQEDNTAVVVQFAEGDRWWATFYTYTNLAGLVEKYRHTGENLSGKYFQGGNAVFVDEVSRERIEEVVAHMNANGELERCFRKVVDTTRSLPDGQIVYSGED